MKVISSIELPPPKNCKDCLFGGTNYWDYNECNGKPRDLWINTPEDALKFKWNLCSFIKRLKKI